MNDVRPSASFVGIALAVSLGACGQEQGGAAPRAPGSSPMVPGEPPSYWDPGAEPETGSGSCTYGYGEPCPDPVIDCAQGSCVRGQCVDVASGSDYCLCDDGYAGALCDTCAAGYEPRGLECVAIGSDEPPCDADGGNPANDGGEQGDAAADCDQPMDDGAAGAADGNGDDSGAGDDGAGDSDGSDVHPGEASTAGDHDSCAAVPGGCYVGLSVLLATLALRRRRRR